MGAGFFQLKTPGWISGDHAPVLRTQTDASRTTRHSQTRQPRHLIPSAGPATADVGAPVCILHHATGYRRDAVKHFPVPIWVSAKTMTGASRCRCGQDLEPFPVIGVLCPWRPRGDRRYSVTYAAYALFRLLRLQLWVGADGRPSREPLWRRSTDRQTSFLARILQERLLILGHLDCWDDLCAPLWRGGWDLRRPLLERRLQHGVVAGRSNPGEAEPAPQLGGRAAVAQFLLGLLGVRRPNCWVWRYQGAHRPGWPTGCEQVSGSPGPSHNHWRCQFRPPGAADAAACCEEASV